VALRLRQRGIVRVRPLEGGLAAWKSRGYSVEAARSEAQAAPAAAPAGAG